MPTPRCQNHESPASLRRSEVGGKGNSERNTAAQAHAAWKSKRRQRQGGGRKCGEQGEKSKYDCAADQNGLSSQAITEQPGQQRTEQQAHIACSQDRSECRRMNLPRIDQGRDCVADRCDVVTFEEKDRATKPSNAHVQAICLHVDSDDSLNRHFVLSCSAFVVCDRRRCQAQAEDQRSLTLARTMDCTNECIGVG